MWYVSGETCSLFVVHNHLISTQEDWDQEEDQDQDQEKKITDLFWVTYKDIAEFNYLNEHTSLLVSQLTTLLKFKLSLCSAALRWRPSVTVRLWPHMALHGRRRDASHSRSSSLRCVCCIMLGDITRSVEQPGSSDSTHSHCRPCWRCYHTKTTSQLHQHYSELFLIIIITNHTEP